MITLLLDTNILHQEGLASWNMRQLRRLINASHVEVYIPELVKKEFLTKRVMESKEKLKIAHSSLLKVEGKVSKTSEAKDKTVKAQSYIKEVEEIIGDVIYQDFSDWENDLSVNILPFDPDVMSVVLEEYFSGAGVFRKPKYREDIPDAIISKNIESLISAKQEITVAIKDSAFKNHLREYQEITLVDSLGEFLNLESNTSKIAELDSLSTKAEEVSEYFYSAAFNSQLLTYLTRSTSEIADIYLEGRDITNKDKLEVETFGEQINYAQASTVHGLVIEGVSHLSSTSYELKVSFEAKSILNYCAHYGEYIYLEEDTYRVVSLDSMNGDGYCDLSELFNFKFHGRIEIEFQEDLDTDSVKSYSRDLGSDGNPITAVVDIYKAEIVNT